MDMTMPVIGELLACLYGYNGYDVWLILPPVFDFRYMNLITCPITGICITIIPPLMLANFLYNTAHAFQDHQDVS